MFKTFPEFTKLTLKDREEYESYIKGFPPIGDIEFKSLMLWWNGVGEIAVSVLNGNLVISYWFPGDEQRSGLSLVGTHNVDESMCTIFDYLRSRGERPRVFSIPEFVVNELRYPDLFQFKTDGSSDEYVLSLAKFAEFDNLPQHMRIGIRKFVRKFGEGALQIKNISLKSEGDRQLLLDASERWPLKGVNNMSRLARKIFPLTITMGPHLGIQCAGLFVNDELEAYCLYSASSDERYITIAHARVNYDIPRIFSYLVHAFSKYEVARGATYANIHADNGSLTIRAIKIALRPDHFFRKYNIEPVPVRKLSVTQIFRNLDTRT